MLTPSHQFPTGTVLSAARRTALLNWASAKEHTLLSKMIMTVNFVIQVDQFLRYKEWTKEKKSFI